MREPHGFSSSLSYCPDSKIPLQGAAWGGPPAGAGDHPAGLQRTGREDHPWRSVTRSCAYVCRDPAPYCSQRLRAPGKGTLIAQDTAGV